MKRLILQLAAASLALVVGAHAAVRPRYGGTLRVEMRAALTSLGPISATQNSAAQQRVSGLIFEPLLTLDERAQPRAALAYSWQHTPDYKMWQFWLRPAKFQDGSTVTAATVIASLLAANPQSAWRARADGESVIFESDSPLPQLTMELARASNAIYIRGAGGDAIGTGPFRVSQWQPAKRALLTANEDYWNGRPFLDAIDITLDRPLRDQMIDLELGTADVIEVAIDQGRRAMQQGRRVVSSAPIEIVAVLFNSERRAGQDAKLREAVAHSIDRKAIYEVLLQRQGEPAANLVPQWMGGYAYLFPAAQNLERARQLRNEARVSSFILNYDFSDSLARSIAERIALNGQEAGITLQTIGENLPVRSTGDARLVRMRLESAEPAAVLRALAAALGQPLQVPPGASLEQVYRAEKSVLDTFGIIPLAHVPEIYGLSPRVRNWSQPRAAGWPVLWGEVWVEGKN